MYSKTINSFHKLKKQPSAELKGIAYRLIEFYVVRIKNMFHIYLKIVRPVTDNSIS